MPRPGTLIPKEPVMRIMQKAGAKRISLEAAEELVNLLTAQALEIGARAAQIAVHVGRKTVQAGDVKLAAKV
ncbi:NFYB/HAP3 family transcription factor subunit [Candidatus Woesearchaeota archaeon]|nr:NFYB/HAP3 family transcription factor subunit [Candidatus Woesearchaeota archaeon]